MRVLIAKQTDKNTVATDDFKILDFTDFSLKPNISTTESKTINETGFKKGGWVSKIDTSGDVTVEATIGQIETILGSAGFEAGASPADKNKYKGVNKFDKYLTVVLDDNETESHDIFKSLLVNTLSFDTQLESYVNLKIGFIGMDSEVRGTKFAPATDPTAFEGNPLVCLGATITENASEVTNTIESITIDFNNSLEGKGALNSVYNKSIKRNGEREVKLSLKYNEFDKNSYIDSFTKLKANTTYSVKVVFKEIETNKQVELEFPRCKVGNVERDDVTGNQTMSKEIIAEYDEANKSPVIITIKK